MGAIATVGGLFEDFLEHGGAELLATKNPWDVVRFKTARGTHVVYKNAKGNHSFSDDHAQQAWNAWQGKKPWMAPDKTKRREQIDAAKAAGLTEFDSEKFNIKKMRKP